MNDQLDPMRTPADAPRSVVSRDGSVVTFVEDGRRFVTPAWLVAEIRGVVAWEREAATDLDAESPDLQSIALSDWLTWWGDDNPDGWEPEISDGCRPKPCDCGFLALVHQSRLALGRACCGEKEHPGIDSPTPEPSEARKPILSGDEPPVVLGYEGDEDALVDAEDRQSPGAQTRPEEVEE